MIDNYEIQVISGDTYKLEITYKDSTGELIDVTGYKLYTNFRKSKDENIVWETSSVVGSEGIEGLVTFALTSSDTSFLDSYEALSKYVFSMRLVNVGETEVQTILAGTIEVI